MDSLKKKLKYLDYLGVILPLLILIYWHFLNREYPRNDSADYLKESFRISRELLSSKNFNSVIKAFYSYEAFRPLSHPLFGVPFVFVFKKVPSIVFYYNILGLGITLWSLQQIAVRLIKPGFCFWIPALLGTYVQLFVNATRFYSEMSLIPLLSLGGFLISRKSFKENSKLQLLTGIVIGMSFTVRPAISLLFLLPPALTALTLSKSYRRLKFSIALWTPSLLIPVIWFAPVSKNIFSYLLGNSNPNFAKLIGEYKGHENYFLRLLNLYESLFRFPLNLLLLVSICITLVFWKKRSGDLTHLLFRLLFPCSLISVGIGFLFTHRFQIRFYQLAPLMVYFSALLLILKETPLVSSSRQWPKILAMTLISALLAFQTQFLFWNFEQHPHNESRLLIQKQIDPLPEFYTQLSSSVETGSRIGFLNFGWPSRPTHVLNEQTLKLIQEEHALENRENPHPFSLDLIRKDLFSEEALPSKEKRLEQFKKEWNLILVGPILDLDSQIEFPGQFNVHSPHADVSRMILKAYRNKALQSIGLTLLKEFILKSDGKDLRAILLKPEATY